MSKFEEDDAVNDNVEGPQSEDTNQPEGTSSEDATTSGQTQNVEDSPRERIKQALGTHDLSEDVCCPAHNDGDPSLSVDVTTDGKVLLHCHAGCTTEEVVKALNIEWSDLFPGDDDWDLFDPCVTETRYTYRDAEGKPLFDVVRFEVTDCDHPAYGQKKFRQQAYKPSHSKAGRRGCPKGYVWGRSDVSTTLFRRPKVKQAAASGERVFVVEGEKDVLTLEERDLVATTNPQGAGEWERRYTEILEGAEVCILPDNDETGRDHASAVASDLTGEAKSVRVIGLPDLPKKGDVTDWIEDGHTRKELLNLADETEEWEQTTKAEESDQEEQLPDSEIFWCVNEKGEVKIDRLSLFEFLEDQGFRKLYGKSDLESTLVRVQSQVVRRTSIERIKDVVVDHARQIPDNDGLPLEGNPPAKGYSSRDVKDALLRAEHVYFSKSLFEFLPELELEFHQDTADAAYFYFQNGFVEVTQEGFELRPYGELDGVIWQDQIIPHKFEDLTKDGNPLNWDWGRFLRNVSGDDPDRHDALTTSIGYLLHGYKDPAMAKSIAFVDEKISDVPSGRSGKSLVGEAISEVVSSVRIDAKNFSFESRFRFQNVELDTQVLEFNDAPKGFSMERLFSAITDDMQVEKKGQDSVTIGFKNSPKFLLSTNYVIEGEGPSFNDRIFEVEFHPHYDADHRPVDDFDDRFFEEWSEAQWTRFYNVMLYCVRKYLKESLSEYEHVNLEERKLRGDTDPDFAEWVRGQKPGWHDKKDLFKSFKSDYEGDHPTLTQSMFTRWCNQYGRIFTGDKLQTKKSGSTRKIKLPDLEG